MSNLYTADYSFQISNLNMVWIIGNKGMLGCQLSKTLSENKIDFTGTDSEVSILDYSALENFTEGKNISFIVNCAAYTAVDKAESDAEFAGKLNAEGPSNIAKIAKKLNCPLIHISTDYVFDGKASEPITEDTPVKPIGVYGSTKAQGEKNIAAEWNDYYILRTAWLYGFYGKNFVYTMCRLMNKNDSIKVVGDQKGTPTNCETLAGVISKIISERLNGKSVKNGIYNVTDLGQITWFDFANEIYKLGFEKGHITNRMCSIKACSTSEYPTPAERPAYSVLDKAKIQKELGIELPDWQASLGSFMSSKNFDNKRIEQ